jgi:2'-5' RNA ligase
MLHRIFLAINLPDNVKRKLLTLKDKYQEIPAKWVREENLHITLLFLGNLDDNQLSQTIKTIQEVCEKQKPLVVNLKKACFSQNQSDAPRMVWVEGEGDATLFSLQKKLEEKIFNLDSFKYKEKENKAFLFHVTLARIRQWEFKKLEEIPEINENLNLRFEVNTIEIMESELKKGGPEYTILDSFELENGE